MFRISYFESEQDNRPRSLTVEWSQLVDQLAEPRTTACAVFDCPGSACKAKLGPAWSPAAYPPGLRRGKKNVSAVCALVLDHDHKTEAELLAIDAKLAPYKRITHASHSDRPGDRCTRTVLALDPPVSGADWQRFRATALRELGIADDPDPSTKDASRIYFTPSRPTDADFLFDVNDGIPLDVAAILAKAPPLVPDEPVVLPGAAPIASSETIQAAALELASAWPAKGRHDAFLALAGGLALHGWPEDSIIELTTLVATLMPGSDEKAVGPDRAAQAASSIAAVQRGEHVKGWGALAQVMTRPGTVDSVRDRLGMRDAPTAADGLMSVLAAKAPPTISGYPSLDAISASVGASGVNRPTSNVLAEYGSDLRSYLGADDPGDDPDAWLIYGVMPAGVPVVIGGHPKSWKTFLAEDLAISCAAGIDWQGRKAKRCRVLILPREDSVRETRKRIWRIARGRGIDPRDLDEWLRIDSKTPFYFSDKEDVARMRRTIEAWRPELIVIDSLSRTHTGDENSKKEMSVVTSTWGDLCQEYELTLATIHHFVKTGEGTLLQKLRGSGDIGALVRHIIGVDKHPDGTLELSFEGNLHPLPEPFLVRMVDALDDHGHKVIRFEDAGSPKASNIQRIDRAIVDYVASGGPEGVTGAEIEKAVQGKNDDIRARVKELRETGKIIRPVKRYHPALAPREVPAEVVLGARLIGGEK